MGPVWRRARASDSPLSALPRTRVVVEASKRDPRPVSARRAGLRTVLGRFEARNRPAGSSRAVPRSARWRGRRPMRYREDSKGRPERSAYGFSLSAGWLVGARRRAGSRLLLGTLPSRDADLCCLCSRRVLRRRKASPLFKLWSSEPLVKISHSCQCGTLVQRARDVIHLQPASLLQKTTESGLTSCARLRAARPLIYEVLSC